ncbi:hypothetical protein DPMN_036423 [Dreissena polymorpha]|uniref:Transmembrane protein n=1 Tax=Dreissena polymorpha TaxID=45954 RepID=A0A9D4RLW8_DREPO|nr:hypothetical protein DPMN_036423 [Dreissena polymorpha]
MVVVTIVVSLKVAVVGCSGRDGGCGGGVVDICGDGGGLVTVSVLMMVEVIVIVLVIVMVMRVMVVIW